MFTQVTPVRDVLVLLPADQTVVVHVEVFPLMLHAVVNVLLLSVFDPNLQLLLRDKTVFVTVDFLHDDPVERHSVVMKALSQTPK